MFFLISQVPLYVTSRMHGRDLRCLLKKVLHPPSHGPGQHCAVSASSSLLLRSLELRDTKVYEPFIRALLGTGLTPGARTPGAPCQTGASPPLNVIIIQHYCITHEFGSVLHEFTKSSQYLTRFTKSCTVFYTKPTLSLLHECRTSYRPAMPSRTPVAQRRGGPP